METPKTRTERWQVNGGKETEQESKTKIMEWQKRRKGTNDKGAHVFTVTTRCCKMKGAESITYIIGKETTITSGIYQRPQKKLSTFFPLDRSGV